MTDRAHDPISESIKWLVEHGFTDSEAKNLCAAIRADTQEELLRNAGAWLEWCAKIKMNHDCVVMLAANGMIRVSFGSGGAPDDMRVELAT